MLDKKWLVAGATAAGLVLGLVPGTAVASGPRCKTVEIPVAMSAGKPRDAKIAGTLCRPLGRDRGVLQVLIPGGGYDRNYWSWRGDPRGPSYVEAMNRAGYATFALDRIGTGKSSAPPSSAFAPDSQTYTIHQGLRALGHQRIVLVGNSLGSTIARMIAVHYPADVDGLILTGESSTPNWAAFEQLGADYITAGQHPLLASRNLDDGYGVLRPGVRRSWFYWGPTAASHVVARDEANPEPDVFPSDPEFGSVLLNRKIKVPVLVVVGQHDRLICGPGASDCSSSTALLAGERPYYAPTADLQALAVPNTGHVLNLHQTAPTFYPHLAHWTNSHIRR
ncbi:alpha/beta hydrolase [Kribbella catacumbae]|uniref:alpha/beta hydrolase n=1 Tax=Kribbella catacumbae TaxID=460086 RepID=UPI00035D2009|nr:alpha/beta hydrolase [Kribbella catacumbae]